MDRKLGSGARILAALAAAALASSASAGSFEVRPGRRVEVPVRSWRALRDEGVVRQAFDYSCGSAALATLLSRPGAPVAEQSILMEVLSVLPEAEMGRTLESGLTLLDLKRAAERRGHRADGFRVEPRLLPKLSRPVIVFIRPRGYEHFAVLRGVRGDRVHLADPARGNVRMPAWRFLEMWSDDEGRGVIFVVENAGAPPLPVGGPPQPELLGARQLLEIGNPYVRLPRLR